ncbi:D-alanine--D-alanine ligase family protein [Candidatus Rhabdochlamydia sp. W815]|uniref:D-alanine--D-alanine ligase family protein n=1 Tax=Candidatus Rhabdochlamydia sp. W815 TaxID=2720721 RepID=UPI001BFC9A4B|nr:D-alanine--D-alanine ligase family protein [Candidatus Rhabdochlamydia sp. W815]KAG6559543.1 D-alanine--D-alanine ligase A [Candidatus Rhabdochlamydia sp. W815]
MKKKVRLGLLFGGKSTEHEVSLISAKNILEALDLEKYEPVLMSINKQGQWHLETQETLRKMVFSNAILENFTEKLAIVPIEECKQIVSYKDSKLQESLDLDVIFPILHGVYGEDGTIQGLLQLANIPFVGAGVLGSAMGMDKDVMKRLLQQADIPVAPFICLHDYQEIPAFEEVVLELGCPFFVNPANTGSSIGITKVSNQVTYLLAIKNAFLYDRKILLEKYVQGREIECAVLGNEDLQASLPGEIEPLHEFYSYEAKYLDAKRAKLHIPASLAKKQITHIQTMAMTVFRTLCCEGMARVDFFLTKNQELLVNEINTIPGFTRISMYPKLWEISGLSYSQLIDQLIQLAIIRHEKRKKIQTRIGG